MSAYTDRLDNLKAHARDAEEQPRLALEESQWPDQASHERFEGVIAYAQSVLEATDPELLTQSAYDQISNAFLQFANNPTQVPANIDPWCDALLIALLALPASRNETVGEGAKAVVANVQRSAYQRLGALDRKAAETEQALQALRTAIAESDSQTAATVEQRLTTTDARIEERAAAIETRLAQYASQMDSDQQANSALRTQQTTAFEEAEAARTTRAKERTESADADLKAMLAKAQRDLEARLSEIRRMEQESAQLVGAIGLAGTAERYAEEVKEQKKIADFWRWATVVLAVIAVAGAVFAVAENHPAAESFAGKLGLSLIIGGIATYAARQSAYHRHREQRARDLQLELTAFSPFIEPLSPEQQEEERVIMTRKTFGKIAAGLAADEEPGPTAISQALRRKNEAEPS